MPSAASFRAYSGPAYQRTSWPRPARWAATPVSGLKCPSAGMDANRILIVAASLAVAGHRPELL